MTPELLNNNPLFKECLHVLEAQLLPERESSEISALFISLFPITKWGKIDWKIIDKKISVGQNPNFIIPALEKLIQSNADYNVYIEWSSAGVPVIKNNLKKIINSFDYVTCVDFDKFIFNPIQGYVIEILSGGEITIGLISKINEQI